MAYTRSTDAGFFQFIRSGLLTAVIGAILCSPTTAEPSVDFTHDIRPILSDICFKCHGPDENQRKADLRLDTRDGAIADLGGYAAIVPGHADRSEVIRRLTSNDPDEIMPPPDTGKTLTPQQIEHFRQWINEGAVYEKHWAFVPPQRPELPATRQSDWVRSPVDRFIAAKLDASGLSPSPRADKATLLRRLSLDLIGLPPTLEELDAFLEDESPDAYDKQVERLLRSPHYGEKWGRWWLDGARYADSDGFEKDKPRFVWFYRDYVIRSLNRDLPINQFIVEQLAGDLLPNATQDQIVATGFLRNSMINEEGGIDPEQFRMEAMFDRMDALGKGVLGLTIQCAQCHTHKYDPLTHTDYYRMFAFLNNSHEANVTVYTAEEQQQRAELFAGIRQVEMSIEEKMPDWTDRLTAWEQSLPKQQAEWTVLDKLVVEDDFAGGQKFIPRGDGSYIAQGYAPTLFRPLLMATVQPRTITGFQLEMLTDENLPRGGPGRSIFGTAALSEFEVEYADESAPEKKTKVKFVRATADLNMPEQPINEDVYKKWGDKPRVTGPIEFAIDDKRETAWTTDAGAGRRNQPRTAVFVPEQPIVLTQPTILSFWLSQYHGGPNSDQNQNYSLGRFRLAITDTPDPQASPVPPRVRSILATSPDRRSEAQQQAVFHYWRTTQPELAKENEAIEALWQQHPQGTTQLVLDERDAMRSTHRLERGSFLDPAESVDAGVPDFLNPWPADAPRNRLGFAMWLTDRSAPTTARAIVNRIWQEYFGIGIVETSEDLGLQSTAPSHPQLLDWLAVQFMDSGWSLKDLHRQIVRSATYQQQSRVSPELLQRDPYNRLLARGPRFRVPGELVRDIALATSGLLDRRIGGPPVYPPAPRFLFDPPASYGPKDWPDSTGGDRYRRAIYTFRYRSVPYPVLDAFDTPNGDAACVRRARSNSPLQALAMLNEDLFMEAARELAIRVLMDGGNSPESRIDLAFRRVLSRKPTDPERAILADLLQTQRQRLAQDDSAAWQLAADNPDQPPDLPEGATAADLAAWTVASRVLLNLDETITKP